MSTDANCAYREGDRARSQEARIRNIQICCLRGNLSQAFVHRPFTVHPCDVVLVKDDILTQNETAVSNASDFSVGDRDTGSGQCHETFR